MNIAVGTKVRIERDETLYPSKGTWPQFRGKTGTVVQVNVDRERPHLTEYAVTFGKFRKPNQHGTIPVGPDTYWFKAYELLNIAPVLPPSDTNAAIEGKGLVSV
jgi:hypothetical protein